ncbi:MAG: nucleoside-triphosphatase, partial [Methanoregulaceae archaeon]|nr:nucleoside-triphosphatase [Methanoregulaceae archaeon]
LVGFDNRERILAHTAFGKKFRVGRYGVDIGALEDYIAGVRVVPETQLVVVDEIGRMECLSPLFRDWVSGVLSSGVPCLATIALHGDKFIEGIKQRDDVVLYTLRKDEGGVAFQEVLAHVKAMVREI